MGYRRGPLDNLVPRGFVTLIQQKTNKLHLNKALYVLRCMRMDSRDTHKKRRNNAAENLTQPLAWIKIFKETSNKNDQMTRLSSSLTKFSLNKLT